MPTQGEVAVRISYYEIIRCDSNERRCHLPWYQVNMPTWKGGGRLWEPVDAIPNSATQTDFGKGVTRSEDWFAGAHQWYCEVKPDNQLCQLHSFQGWGWPQG